MGVGYLFGVQRNGRHKNAHEVVFQDHLVIFRRLRDRVGGIRLDLAAAGR